MWQRFIQRQAIRFYHDAKPEFRRSDKRPQIKVANSRITRVAKDRRQAEAQVRVPHVPQSGITFEPFPFAVTEQNKIDCLKRVLTPLHDVSYEEQLSTKESYCRNALRVIGRELYKSGTPVRLDVTRLPCQVKKISPSPVLTKYRNKDEFSIWRGHDGKTITVGHMIFPIGKHGDTVCVEPNGLDVIRDETVRATDLIQEFLRTQAKLGVCFSLGTDGGWRRFMIRVNTEGEIMLIGHLSPRTLRVGEVLEERDNFKDFMVRRAQEEGLKLASLYYQPCPNNQCSHRDVPYELLHGSKTMLETVGKLKIQLGPESYIHNSTPGALELFESTKADILECFEEEYASTKDVKPFIINVNCGAGALALYLAEIADRVVGIDRNELSVIDARENAGVNSVQNVEFIAADVEVVLDRVLEKYAKGTPNMIAVADLPNSGLHKNIIETLRQCRSLNKIVFILPKLDSEKIMKNVMSLCLKGSKHSLPPFAPILAHPIDTCPHTQSFQTILVLERLPES